MDAAGLRARIDQIDTSEAISATAELSPEAMKWLNRNGAASPEPTPERRLGGPRTLGCSPRRSPLALCGDSGAATLEIRRFCSCRTKSNCWRNGRSFNSSFWRHICCLTHWRSLSAALSAVCEFCRRLRRERRRSLRARGRDRRTGRGKPSEPRHSGPFVGLVLAWLTRATRFQCDRAIAEERRRLEWFGGEASAADHQTIDGPEIQAEGDTRTGAGPALPESSGGRAGSGGRPR